MKSEKNARDVFPLNVDCHPEMSSQIHRKDKESLSNNQTFMQENLEKGNNMTIFQYLKSKTMKNSLVEDERVSISDYLIYRNNELEKARKGMNCTLSISGRLFISLTAILSRNREMSKLPKLLI